MVFVKDLPGYKTFMRKLLTEREDKKAKREADYQKWKEDRAKEFALRGNPENASEKRDRKKLRKGKPKPKKEKNIKLTCEEFGIG